MTPRGYEWRSANINGGDVSIHRASICFMFCLGQHDEAKHRAGPVLDDLPAIGPPAVWVGEGHGDGEDVDR
jgi:hypothetical protein